MWLQEGERTQRWCFPPGGEPSSLAPEAEGELSERLTEALSLTTAAGVAPRGGSWTPDEVLLPFEVTPRVRGVLLLRSGPRGAFDARAVEHADLLALALGNELGHQQTQAALTERVKELTCVYQIAQIAAEPLPLHEALERIVELLPAAWQEPEATSARISVEGETFRSADFSASGEVLRAPILLGGQGAGWVEVFHAGCEASAAFLPEEQHLIDAVARELASLIERKRAEAERVRLQTQLHHTDRLATIGLLAAGVAHELNEPLASVLGFAQLAAKAPELEESTRADVERVIKAALYAREIIRNLLVFSRQSPQRKVEAKVDAALDQAIALVEPRCATASVTISRQVPATLPPIQADPSQLQQVFLNLLVNAVQAMPGGGVLEISARHEGGAIHVGVQDSGKGIASEDLERVFLPFFTTKDVGEGTGLGLSVVHGIVAAHGGSVAVTSEPGRGTRFEVSLPCSPSKESE
ncbi:MAG TPA: PAS domain-containing sensor histidine kinase [Planctomycetes bacterium]|nr:PAS domain-containing sensor histidine kinase [Planctomycetota bacterium]